MRFLLSLLLSAWALHGAIPPPSTYDWEAQRWQSQIATNSGTLSASSYRVGTYFMQQVKWWGLRPLLGRVNLFLGNDTNAATITIIRDWWTTTDYPDRLFNYTAADYSESTGLTGNGTSKYLSPAGNNTFSLAGQTTINDVHMACYVLTGSNEASYLMGYASAGHSTCGLPISYSGSSYIEFDLANNSASDSSGVGFYLSTRTSTNSRVLYKNGSALVTRTDCSGDLGPGYFVVGAFDSAGTVTAYTTRAYCYYALGKGIPASLVTPYRTAVRNVQLTIHRNAE